MRPPHRELLNVKTRKIVTFGGAVGAGATLMGMDFMNTVHPVPAALMWAGVWVACAIGSGGLPLVTSARVAFCLVLGGLTIYLWQAKAPRALLQIDDVVHVQDARFQQREIVGNVNVFHNNTGKWPAQIDPTVGVFLVPREEWADPSRRRQFEDWLYQKMRAEADGRQAWDEQPPNVKRGFTANRPKMTPSEFARFDAAHAVVLHLGTIKYRDWFPSIQAVEFCVWVAATGTNMTPCASHDGRR